ncbi:hypothetical protein PENANT_c031G05136 [Penicillium antarcticum]|uniref:Uncharacterized protein n=1 Tax=Penicillium antarcticum TaxID=416450 RepID=A0A1V6PV61_9EURO|nr:uncharacterized protein N7508_005520 [Penicillium antarcticum]KAJ5306505.1 hypothetical protein N7508_005520 [Penicillium antarcticum]OQD80855.1 hypothetical protein PENANT_c031G05136 [Penicillium antarcticum]
MPEEPKHRKSSLGGLMDRMLHRDHHENKDQAGQAKDEHDSTQVEHEDMPSQPKKEDEMDKMKDYMKKDEQMEQEGRTYGDLM